MLLAISLVLELQHQYTNLWFFSVIGTLGFVGNTIFLLVIYLGQIVDKLSSFLAVTPVFVLFLSGLVSLRFWVAKTLEKAALFHEDSHVYPQRAFKNYWCLEWLHTYRVDCLQT